MNTHGRSGKNVSCDLHMEHLNHECKLSLSGLGSNITDHSVERVSRCIGRLVLIMEHFDVINGIPSKSGRHSHHSRKPDLDRIVKQLTMRCSVGSQDVVTATFLNSRAILCERIRSPN